MSYNTRTTPPTFQIIKYEEYQNCYIRLLKGEHYWIVENCMLSSDELVIDVGVFVYEVPAQQHYATLEHSMSETRLQREMYIKSRLEREAKRKARKFNCP